MKFNWIKDRKIFISKRQQDICCVKEFAAILKCNLFSIYFGGGWHLFILISLENNCKKKIFWTYEIPTRKNFRLGKPTRKNFGPTKYPGENILDPQNTHEKNLTRWNGAHKI